MIDPLNGDFGLGHGSAAINSGAPDWDLDGETWEADPDGTRKDMGAYYYPILSGEIHHDLSIRGQARLDDIIEIPPSISVNVEAGSEIEVAAGSQIRIQGAFHANGSEVGPINFVSNSDWGGFWSIGGHLELDYVNLQLVTTGVEAEYSTGYIRNSSITHSVNTGIFLNHAPEFEIVDNVIHDGSAGVYLISSPTTLLRNDVRGHQDFGLYAIESSASLEDNSFRENSSGIVLDQFSDATLTKANSPINPVVNNTIAENYEIGIYIVGDTYPLLGTYIEKPDEIIGGWNKFVPRNTVFDVVNETGDALLAKVNYWDGDPYSLTEGEFYFEPLADEFGQGGLGKGGLTQTSFDYLPAYLTHALALELEENYPAAIAAYSTIVQQYDDHHSRRVALGGLVRTSYKAGSLADLDNSLTGYYDQYTPSRFGLTAGDYLISVLADQRQFWSAIHQAVQVYQDYVAADTLRDQAAAVLFEQALLYRFLQHWHAGIAKMSQSQITNALEINLHTILTEYGDTPAAEYVQLIFGQDVPATGPAVPTEVALENAYPNPFNPVTTITYGIPESQEVRLTVYDVTGRVVKTVVHTVQEPGTYTAQWDGTNALGQTVASGLYFYELRIPTKRLVKKMMLTR